MTKNSVVLKVDLFLPALDLFKLANGICQYWLEIAIYQGVYVIKNSVGNYFTTLIVTDRLALLVEYSGKRISIDS